MYDMALDYKANHKKFIKNLVNNLGYDKCHQIKAYDASKCEKDCRKLEKSEFAKDCKKKHSGVFKCCIRCDR